MLTLHIGLPKTATTFLQYQVFVRGTRFRYFHHKRTSPLEKCLRHYFRVPDSELGALEAEITACLPTGDVLVSNENISLDSREPWEQRGPTPESFAERVARLQEKLGPVRVLLGIRRQDQWLGSRYAQSAELYDDFGQADFERRLSDLCDTPVEGGLAWLDYDRAEREISARLLPRHLLLLPMEMLTEDTEVALKTLQRFVGVKGWAWAFRNGKITLEPRNVLSTGEDRWELRGKGGELRLPGELKQRLLARYGPGNRELSRVSGLALGDHGYF